MNQSTIPTADTTPPRKRFKPTFTQAVPSLPDSWDFSSWPGTVYPYTPERGRYLFRFHKDELIRAGAVCRIGAKVVFLGATYNAWMASGTARVRNFEATVHRERDKVAR